MKFMWKITILFLFITGNVFAQNYNCNNELLDTLFSFNFNRINSHFPSELLNETKNLTLHKDEIAFINLISILSGFGPSNINYLGINKLTRIEVRNWQHWYEMNYCKLKYENIIIALYLIENQLTCKDDDIDQALEFPTKDINFIQNSILNKVDSIPCTIRSSTGNMPDITRKLLND